MITFSGGTFEEPSILIGAGRLGRVWFDVIIDPVITTIGGTSTENITKDFIDLVTTGTTATTGYKISVVIENNNACPCGTLDFEFESMSPSIATVDTDGNVEWVSNGTSNIKVIAKNKNTGDILLERIFPVAVNRTNPTTGINPVRFVGQSLGHDLTKSFFRVENLTSNNSTKRVFSLQDHTNQNYVRSNTCWAKDIDFTGVSPWNSNGGVRKGGTLISPRHIIFAKHYQITTGATIRFVTQDNQVVNRTMTAKQSIGSTDITIGVLNEDVPSSIKHYKVLDIESIEGKITGMNYVPVAYFDQEEKVLIANGSSVAPTYSFFNITRWRYTDQNFYPAYYQKFYDFYETPISGDSGNPLFYILNDEPLLQSVFWFSGGGACISFYKNQINTIMNNLGGGYQLEFADLSGYIDYDNYSNEALDYFGRLGEVNGFEPIYANPIATYIDALVAQGGSFWDNLRTSCLFAGVKFNGCFVPLRKGMPVPTHNFTEDMHDIITGLVGDGDTMFINTGVNGNSTAQNNTSLSVYLHSVNHTGNSSAYMGAGASGNGRYTISYTAGGASPTFRVQNSTTDSSGTGSAVGLLGVTRGGSTNYSRRSNGGNATVTRASQAPINANMALFRAAINAGNFSNARLKTYHFSNSINLATLEGLQNTLFNAIT
jgi:hypothetical protein